VWRLRAPLPFWLLVSLPWPAHAQIDAATRAGWNRPVAPFRIVENIYYVGASEVSSFLIVGDKGAFVLDGGLPESAPIIARNIRELGFRLGDVKILINSHAHFDHAGGLAELKRLSGAKMYASRADSVTLASGRHANPSGHAPSVFPQVSVDHTVEDGEVVRLGKLELTAHLTPGHTRGCTSWTMRAGEHAVLFHCSTTFPGYRLVDNPDYPEIARDYERSFATLRSLDCDVLLAPHGSFFQLSERMRDHNFVDRAGCRAFIEKGATEFARELARQRQVGSARSNK
jgi:metallo-beta-lactamase class B